MNLVKAQELAKELSITDLRNYANGSNPEMMPPYIALGALQAKEIAEKKMQSMQGGTRGEQPSVKEQLEQKAGLMALQGQQQQQAQQQMMQQAQSQPMPVPEGAPQPEAQPQEEPIGMAAGGITRLPVNFNFRNGGIIGYAGPEGSAVDAFGVELDNARAAKQQALAQLRRFGLQQKIKDPQGYIQAETAFREADAREKKAMQEYSGKLEGTAAARPATNVRDIGQAYKEIGFDEPEQAPVPQAEPQKPALSPADMAMRKAPGGLPAAAQRLAPAAAPAMPPQVKPAAPMPQAAQAPQVTQAPQAPQVSDQDKLIAEEAARRKAFGIDKEIGADAEGRMAARRQQFEAAKPTGLQDLIRIFGQSAQYKGGTGLAPAYTANEDRKRAEQAAFEAKMEEQQAAMENARRAERVSRAGGIGEGLGKLREIGQREAEAKARNLTSIEVANIQRAAQGDPKSEERLFDRYSKLKETNPTAAAEMMQFLRGGAAASKGTMTRNEAIDNVNKLMVDPSARMDMKKEAAAALGKKDPSFSEVHEYFVQKNMGGVSSPGATPPPRFKFDSAGKLISGNPSDIL
jgi:hypothetical protein